MMWLVVGLALWAGGPGVPAAEPPPPASTNAAVAPAAGRPPRDPEEERILRSYLQLQEQLHTTLLAIEQARVENTVAARTNADALAARLELMEKALDRQRGEHAEALRGSNRTLLTLAGVFVGVGFLTLLLMAFFQLRGMNRLAEIATGMPVGPGLASAALTAGGEARLLGPGGPAPETSRLLGVIDRLERRIAELEGSARPAGAMPGIAAGATIDVTPAGQDRRSVPMPSAGGDTGVGQVAMWLGKGQTLLNLGQHEGALRCFDEALAVAPDHAEAHVRRGQALERLKRLDDAVASYDRALALDRTFTQAYLGKGSVFNQQERYGEALDCYEQALRSEAAPQAAAGR